MSAVGDPSDSLKRRKHLWPGILNDLSNSWWLTHGYWSSSLYLKWLNREASIWLSDSVNDCLSTEGWYELKRTNDIIIEKKPVWYSRGAAEEVTYVWNIKLCGYTHYLYCIKLKLCLFQPRKCRNKWKWSWWHSVGRKYDLKWEISWSSIQKNAWLSLEKNAIYSDILSKWRARSDDSIFYSEEKCGETREMRRNL